MSSVYIGPNSPDVDVNLCSHRTEELEISHCVHDWRILGKWGVVPKTGDGTHELT